MFSLHPRLYSEYGSPRKAAALYCKKCEELLENEHPADGGLDIELSQTLILLNVYDYSNRNGGRSHFYNTMAVRLADRVYKQQVRRFTFALFRTLVLRFRC